MSHFLQKRLGCSRSDGAFEDKKSAQTLLLLFAFTCRGALRRA